MTHEPTGTQTSIVPRLWSHLSNRRRLQLAVALAITVFASIAEVLSIGAIVPFLTVMATPDKALGFAPVKPLIDWMGVNSVDELRAPLTMLFCSGVVVASTTRLALVWFQARLAGVRLARRPWGAALRRSRRPSHGGHPGQPCSARIQCLAEEFRSSRGH